MQMHTNIISSDEDIKKAIKKIAATGLLVHISELDVGVNPPNDQALEFSEALAQQQANKYAFIVQQYNSLYLHNNNMVLQPGMLATPTVGWLLNLNEKTGPCYLTKIMKENRHTLVSEMH
jgi:hypothetical protein